MQKEINPDILFSIFPFLELSDLTKCQIVCKIWNSIILAPALWKTISDKSDKKIPQPDLFHLWLIDKIKRYKPEKLLIYDCGKIWKPKNILEIFSEYNENLTKIKLFFELEESVSNAFLQKIKENCPNLKSFKTHGKFLTDENMIIFQNFGHLTDFGIYNDDSNFMGINLKYLNPLKKLFLRPHNVEFESLMPLIEKSKSHLKKICFDCEIIEKKQLFEILCKLSNQLIETLLMNFCEKFDDEVLVLINRFQNLKKFKFSKGNSIKSEGFDKFFDELDCKNLVSLNLSECSEIENAAILLIANKAKGLKKLNLSWCIDLTSDAISEVFKKCLYLKKIYLTGIKKLNRLAFPVINEMLDYFDKDKFLKNKKEKKIENGNFKDYFKSMNGNEISKKINYYGYLKYVNVRSCDFVEDEILFILKLIFPYMKLINYYGEDVLFEF